MDLPELYAELQRRGMKAHPRLREIHSRQGDYWANGADGYCLAPYHPDDARAILVPHVREWLASLRSETPKIYKPEITVNWYEHDDITNVGMTSVKCDGIHHEQTFHGLHPDDAFLLFAEEATRHLAKVEPA